MNLDTFNYHDLPDVANLEYTIQRYKRSWLVVSIQSPDTNTMYTLSCVPIYVKFPAMWVGGRLVPATNDTFEQMRNLFFGDEMAREKFEASYAMYVCEVKGENHIQILGGKFELSVNPQP